MAGKRKTHRADDKRSSGLSHNVPRTARVGSVGSAKPAVMHLFHDRRSGFNGNGKRAK
jgi:hypothetical protein